MMMSLLLTAAMLISSFAELALPLSLPRFLSHILHDIEYEGFALF